MISRSAGVRPPARGDTSPETGKSKTYVRVLGTRLGRFVEFEYFLDDGLLSVELILPLAAFDEFCRAQDATIIPPTDDEKATEIERLAWREKQPGLLRRPTPSDTSIPGREDNDSTNQND